jgi:hypothetical protein
VVVSNLVVAAAISIRRRKRKRSTSYSISMLILLIMDPLVLNSLDSIVITANVVGLPIIGWLTADQIVASNVEPPSREQSTIMLPSVHPIISLGVAVDAMQQLVVVAVAVSAAVAAIEGYGWRLTRVLWTQALPIVLWTQLW